MPDPRLILASQSAARRNMLSAAGLQFETMAANLDEAALKTEMLQKNPGISPAVIADGLAAAKAEAVSRKVPDALVIGADQVLAFEGGLLTKAGSLEEATSILKKLSGKKHHLISAVVLATGGRSDWSHVDAATLTVRPLSEKFLTEYVDVMGDRLLKTVGCYELEGRGVQLFDRIDGDYFTVLGMPLLPLLGELRRRGAVLT